MKNIGKIFIDDILSLTKNFFALVIVVGICFLPALYAWFNIYSNWDPYGNTDSYGFSELHTHRNLSGISIRFCIYSLCHRLNQPTLSFCSSANISSLPAYLILKILLSDSLILSSVIVPSLTAFSTPSYAFLKSSGR